MEQNQNHPLLMEVIPQWLCKLFRAWRFPFLASLLWGVLAYTFAFTNKLINHDETSQLFAKGATVTSGRWASKILRGSFYIFNPTLHTIVFGRLHRFLFVLLDKTFSTNTSYYPRLSTNIGWPMKSAKHYGFFLVYV